MNIKKLTAAVLTFAMTAAVFTGCGKTYEKVATVGGVDIAPNTYLFAQYQAYNEAVSLVSDSKTDVLNTLIEDTDSKEWIHNKTIDNLQLYVWTDKTFDEMGLELTQEETDYINSQVEYYWPYLEASYTPNGIGMETYRAGVVNSYKLEKIFNTLYGEGGEKEPSDEETKQYMSEKYARIKGFRISKTDDGNQITDAEKLAQLVVYCEEAVNELNNGADFETVQVKYMTLAGQVLGKDTDYSENLSQYTENRFLSKSNPKEYEEVLTANAFTLEVNGKFEYDETETDYIVYQRVENTTSDDELAYYKSTLLSEMKGEEFDEYSMQQAEVNEVAEDSAAVKYYSVNKIK